MENLTWYLAGLAVLATGGVLLFGIGGFGTGKMTPQRQNQLMRWRIIAQFVAVVLIMLTIWVSKG